MASVGLDWWGGRSDRRTRDCVDECAGCKAGGPRKFRGGPEEVLTAVSAC